jgi:hypothetical protein
LDLLPVRANLKKHYQGAEKVSTVEQTTEKRAGVGRISTSSERDNQLSADNNDAPMFTDADFAEIEAFANDSALSTLR